jgi:hypothetical protein
MRVRDLALAPVKGTSANYEGRPLRGRVVGGPLSDAVAAHLGRPARLLMLDAAERGADDAPVTLMSRASLAALAPELRGKRDVTFGIWCDVVAPGRIRVGDPVAVT